MSKFWKYTLINIGIIYAIALIVALSEGFGTFLIAPIVIAGF